MRPIPRARRALLASHVTAALLAGTSVLTGPPDIALGGGLDTVINNRWGSAGDIALAAGSYLTINAMLAIIERHPHQPPTRTRDRPARLVDTATACLGLLAALALATQPALTLLLTPPLLLLHHGLRPQHSITDGKTGLLSATAWHHHAHHELSRAARRPTTTLGVLMIDLDHFKQVNDTFGHLAGDSVLHAVATAITATVRDYDIVARFGGDEFVVLLPATTAAPRHHSRRVLQRGRTHSGRHLHPRRQRRSWPRRSDHRQPDRIARDRRLPRPRRTVQTLLRSADTALYAARNAGRNTVETTVSVAKEAAGEMVGDSAGQPPVLRRLQEYRPRRPALLTNDGLRSA